MQSVQYTYHQLMNPLIQALKHLGGSGTNEEIYNKVSELVQIPAEQLDIPHSEKDGGIGEIEYRLAWTRTYLKSYGIIENSTRGVWSLTSKGSSIEEVDEMQVVRTVRGMSKKNRTEAMETPDRIVEQDWREDLLSVILEMPPDAFERLIQRLLRESGFIQVEVTGRSGDGGIDGHGILRLGGLLSFHVFYQGKRWRGSVGANQVRDFRGAMVGRADKGLFITTGTFTRDAIKEATRDGAPAIDLVDGDQLADKLKQLSLGVKTKIIEVEDVSVDREWFRSI